MMEPKESIRMEGTTSDAADLKKEKNKERRKAVRELQKEKKKLQKEEEFKKNLMSKDSKVVVIDKATFESFHRKNHGKSKGNEAAGSINPSDFPALKVFTEKKEVEKEGEGRRTSKLTRSSWNRLPIAESLKNETLVETFPSLESTFNRTKKKEAQGVQVVPGPSTCSKTVLPKEEPVKEPETNKPDKKKEKIIKEPSKKESTKKSKKKRHKDPVVLNLNELLIAKSTKKDKKLQVLGSKYRKKSQKEFLSGNILDSANPKRNKGKHREKKKKRISNLKLAILKDRIIKAKMREKAVEWVFQNSETDWKEEIDFKVEVEKYLENLKKLKSDLKKKPKKKVVKKEGLGKQEMGGKLLGNTGAAESNDGAAEKTLGSTATSKPLRFSAKFREYCDNALTPALDSSVKELISEIVYLQDRMFARDPIKARARKRHVIGFREAKKYLLLKKVKMLIIAPDLEKSESKDSIFDTINELKISSTAQNVPYVFALDRRKLGYCSKKKVPVSVFAILNYEGTEGKITAVLENLAQAKAIFQNSPLGSNEENLSEIREEQQSDIVVVDDVTSQLASTFIAVLGEKKEGGKDDDDESEEESNPFLRVLSRCDKN